jgi:hypothetical protein
VGIKTTHEYVCDRCGKAAEMVCGKPDVRWWCTVRAEGLKSADALAIIPLPYFPTYVLCQGCWQVVAKVLNKPDDTPAVPRMTCPHSLAGRWHSEYEEWLKGHFPQQAPWKGEVTANWGWVQSVWLAGYVEGGKAGDIAVEKQREAAAFFRQWIERLRNLHNEVLGEGIIPADLPEGGKGESP